MMLLTKKCIIKLMKTDLKTYAEDIKEVEFNLTLWNQKYWTDWFCGSDMLHYN